MFGKKSKTVILAIIALSVIATPVLAATYTVSLDGTGDFNSIEEAENNAVDGDTINISEGVYYEGVNVTTNNVTFNADGPNVTIVAYKSHDPKAMHITGTGVTVDSDIRLVNTSTLTVNKSNSANYDSIANAVDNATAGDIVQITPDTYNESVNVSKDYIILESTDPTKDVTIDATNTSTGDAVYTSSSDITGLIVRDSVVMKDAVLAGGGSGGGTTMGVPNSILIIAAIGVAIIGYNRMVE